LYIPFIVNFLREPREQPAVMPVALCRKKPSGADGLKYLVVGWIKLQCILKTDLESEDLDNWPACVKTEMNHRLPH